MEQIRKTVVLGKKVVLLTGVHSVPGNRASGTSRDIEIECPEKLIETARRNPDAVAFGFVAGHWVAGA